MSDRMSQLLASPCGGEPVLIDFTGRWTRRQLIEAAGRLADVVAGYDLATPTPIALAVGPAAATVVGMLTAELLGVPLVHLDPATTADERRIACRSLAVGLTLETAPDRFWADWSHGDLRLRISRVDPPPARLDLPEGAQIFLTSGSTGQPRGVVRPPSALVADASHIVDALSLSRAGVIVNAAPVFHVYGHAHGLMAPLLAGARLVHLAAQVLPSRLAATVRRFGARALVLVPPHLQLIASSSESGYGDLALAVTGTAPVPSHVVRDATARLGCPLFDAYGSSETGALSLRQLTGDPGDTRLRLLPGVVGHAAPGDGRLTVRTDGLAWGYLDDGRAIPIDPDGYDTADLVVEHGDGSFSLLGRVNSLINVGGRKVNPAEVEQVLLTHPAVTAAHVHAAPDELRGEVPVADVAVNGTVDLDQLHRWCAAHLSPHKRPRHINFRADLRLSPTGKTRAAGNPQREGGPDRETQP